MEENVIGEYLSLQELGAVIDKLSYKNTLPRNDRLAVEKDCLYQIENPIKSDEEESLEKDVQCVKDNAVEVVDDSTTSKNDAGQVEIAASKMRKVLWIRMNRKIVEMIVLALLICVIFSVVILPFFLLIGKSIRPWSPTVSYDHDESCDNTTTTVSCYIAS